MQNVLLRMNLNLLTPSLMRIKQLKTWVLRCHGCFYITKDMTKQFCTRCGKPTLLRTSCSTDKDGIFKVHLKKNMQWNTRGNIYSIPKPVAGSSNTKRIVGGGKGGWGQELILAEDQKEYVNALTGARRKKDKDLMDEDYLPNILSGDRGRAGGRPKVGAGKNVNSRKRK
jgi:RNA-binding protein NOB1